MSNMNGVGQDIDEVVRVDGGGVAHMDGSGGCGIAFEMGHRFRHGGYVPRGG